LLGSSHSLNVKLNEQNQIVKKRCGDSRVLAAN
jgi:hypothetical protein